MWLRPEFVGHRRSGAGAHEAGRPQPAWSTQTPAFPDKIAGLNAICGTRRRHCLHAQNLLNPASLDHRPTRCPPAIAQRLASSPSISSTSRCSSAATMRAEPVAVLHLHHRCRRPEQGGAAEEVRRRPPHQTVARHRVHFVGKAPARTWQPPGGDRFWPLRHLCRALVLAQMGFRPIVLERRRQAVGAHPDTWACGARTISTPNPTCSLARAALHLLRRQALQPDQGSPPPGPQGAHRVREGRRAPRSYVAKPHIGTFRLVGMVENMRAEIIANWAVRSVSSSATDILIEDGQVRGVKTTSRRRS